MSNGFLISYSVLWVLMLLMAICIVVLGRQIGVLHNRMPSRVARVAPAGPEIGEVLAPSEALDIYGARVKLPLPNGRPAVLVVISTTCDTCSELMPGLRVFQKAYRKHFDVVLISRTKHEPSNFEFIERNYLKDFTFIASVDIATKYKVATSPYALIVNSAGQLTAKGMINFAEDLESLVNASEKFEREARAAHAIA
jgi:methylamine dehydrogenase accessory protein MauD